MATSKSAVKRRLRKVKSEFDGIKTSKYFDIGGEGASDKVDEEVVAETGEEVSERRLRYKMKTLTSNKSTQDVQNEIILTPPTTQVQQTHSSITNSFSPYFPPATKTPQPFPHFPPHWEDHFQNIREMRSRMDAPVDSMGCDTLFHPPSAPRVLYCYYYFCCYYYYHLLFLFKIFLLFQYY